MKTLSIIAFTSFLVLWGVYTYLQRDAIKMNKYVEQQKLNKHIPANNPDSPIYKKQHRDLDKIGSVINEKNADIDFEVKDEIKMARKVFDINQNLKEKQTLLEQSYMDHASSIKDIKHLQNEIVETNSKLKKESQNTEKWDPKFVYYLMMQENYTYQEINNIKSLSENGLNSEEINYINDLIKEESFIERINSFKSMGDSGRSIASVTKKPKEKDDFINNSQVAESRESKLIEMNYNQDDKDEIIYGNNQ